MMHFTLLLLLIIASESYRFMHYRKMIKFLKKFKEFHALVERQSCKKLKCICIDNCDEYCGPFDVYCR